MVASTSGTTGNRTMTDHFGSWGTSIDTEVSILTFSLLGLLALCFLTSHLVHTRFPETSSLLPEAATSILVGLAAGIVIDALPASYHAADQLDFNPVVFLALQLPPIIFNSGYHIDR